jgi:uncharacterized protein (DUF2336 family)
VLIDATLFSALEEIAKHGSQERRAEMLKRVTRLFVDGATAFTEQHVQLFDEIFSRLISEIGADARFELSLILADIGNAPFGISRQLAHDDNISVAWPVLQHSVRLEDQDLLDVARSKSQGHLLAISNRSRLTEIITDVLVRRGNREVVRNVAGNSAARLSHRGFSTLVHKAETDGILAEKVGQRLDIPEPLLRELVMAATRVVQKRLFATATPASRNKIVHLLEEISNEGEVTPPPMTAAAAQAAAAGFESEASFDEASLARLADEGLYEETLGALSHRCKIPIVNMHRIMGNKRADPAIVVCKALGFGWQTARSIILLQTGGHGMSTSTLENKRRRFEKLSSSGAKDVMLLWYTMHDECQAQRKDAS